MNLERTPAGLPRGLRAVAIVAAAAVVVVTYVRLYFGVDVTDESFHLVVPYRYTLGDRPYIDEISFAITGPGILAAPFVAAYRELVGLDGIVLFARHLSLLFNAAVAATVYASLRAVVLTRWLCVFVALLAFAFTPLDVHSLNYNTLGNGFFTAGAFLGVAYLHDRRRRFLLGAGVAHGLTVVAYPPLALAVLVYAIVLPLLAGRSSVIGYVGGALVPILLFLVVLWVGGGLGSAVDIVRTQGKVRQTSEVGFGRATPVIRDAAQNFPLAPLAFLACAAALRLHSRHPRVALVAVMLLPLLALPLRPTDLSIPTASVHYVANLGLIAMPLLYLTRGEALSRQLLLLAWVPGLVAGAVVSWSSAENGGHQGIGFFTATLSACIVLGLCAVILERRARLPGSALAVVLAPVLLVVALQFNSSIHDEKPLSLGSRITSGAYAGLFTTSETANLLGSLDRDLRQRSSPRCGLMFFYDFSAGYLLSSARPHTNTAFLSDRADLRAISVPDLLAYYRDLGRVPDLVVRLTRVPWYRKLGRPRYVADDRLVALVHGPRYRRVVDRDAYEVYARRGATCA